MKIFFKIRKENRKRNVNFFKKSKICKPIFPFTYFTYYGIVFTIREKKDKTLIVF